MRQSLRGHPLPESQADFEHLLASGPTPQHTECCLCRTHFDENNVHSAAGWRETQISGYCEDCFDALFDEED